MIRPLMWDYITTLLGLRLAPVVSKDILAIYEKKKLIEYCATEDTQPQINCCVLYMHVAVLLISIDSVFTAQVKSMVQLSAMYLISQIVYFSEAVFYAV